jgi:hypothetical protein
VCIYVIYTIYTSVCAHMLTRMYEPAQVCLRIYLYLIYIYIYIYKLVCVSTFPFQTGLCLIQIQTSSYKSLQCKTTNLMHLRIKSKYTTLTVMLYLMTLYLELMSTNYRKITA